MLIVELLCLPLFRSALFLIGQLFLKYLIQTTELVEICELKFLVFNMLRNSALKCDIFVALTFIT